MTLCRDNSSRGLGTNERWQVGIVGGVFIHGRNLKSMTAAGVYEGASERVAAPIRTARTKCNVNASEVEAP